MKNSLSTKGLSMSQAQSISNLCNQKAQTIAYTLESYNNASKMLHYKDATYVVQEGKPLPENIINLVLEKGLLHSTQAFLMENIKAKTDMMEAIRNEKFVYNEDEPEIPNYIKPTLLEEVDENWGWKQLSQNEVNEFLEVEAYASHIGRFIHKNSTLDKLRKELDKTPSLEWDNDPNGRFPIISTKHHTPEQLEKIHMELAGLHRKYEQRVNYFKAKVKNLVSEENTLRNHRNALEIAKTESINSKTRENFLAKHDAYIGRMEEATQMFEGNRQKTLKEIASLRIKVDERFKPIIDQFLED